MVNAEAVYGYIVNWVNSYDSMFSMWVDIFLVLIFIHYLIRDTISLFKKDVLIRPLDVFVTDSGIKIKVLAVNDEYGRYVLYDSSKEGVRVVPRDEFLRLKGK